MLRATDRTVRSASDLGPIGLTACLLFVFLFPFVSFGAFVFRFPNESYPPAFGILISMLPIGALILAPNKLIARIPVSMIVLLAVGWTIASYWWSEDVEGTRLMLRSDLPIVIAVALTAGLVPIRLIGLWFVRSWQVVAVVTIFALLTDPTARNLESGDVFVEDLSGWHGWFVHKNTMALAFVIALAAVLAFLKSGPEKYLTSAVFIGLIVGAQSTTGLGGLAVVILGYVWISRIRVNDSRTTASNAVIVVAFFTVVVILVLQSLGAVAGVFGKDLTLSGRTEVWDGVVDAIQEQPLVGYGRNAVFRQAVGLVPNEVTAEIWSQTTFRFPHSHQGYLQVTLELGLIGMALYLATFFMGIQLSMRELHNRPELAAFGMLAIASMLVMSMSETLFFRNYFATVVLIITAALRKNDHGITPDVPSFLVPARGYR